MRLRTVTCVALAAVAAVPAATAAVGRVTTVEVGNGFFGPAKKTISQGDKVRFEWIPSLDLHNVHVRSGPERFKSPTQAAGSWSRRFARRGRFLLYCTQHEGMTMKLVVKRR